MTYRGVSGWRANSVADRRVEQVFGCGSWEGRSDRLLKATVH